MTFLFFGRSPFSALRFAGRVTALWLLFDIPRGRLLERTGGDVPLSDQQREEVSDARS